MCRGKVLLFEQTSNKQIVDFPVGFLCWQRYYHHPYQQHHHSSAIEPCERERLPGHFGDGGTPRVASAENHAESDQSRRQQVRDRGCDSAEESYLRLSDPPVFAHNTCSSGILNFFLPIDSPVNIYDR